MSGLVAVAMSGGVDSSTVAALLVRQGTPCVGLTMRTWSTSTPTTNNGRARGCCSINEIRDAELVAARLGIPHYTLNIRDEFEAKVVDDFVREYSAGRTPNPCVRCNQHIKFALLLSRARCLGAEHVATGHYARIQHDETRNRWLLRRGEDPRKDQSYVLYTMTQDQLAHTLFPLGGHTKEETRRTAREAGLRVAGKKDSVEICFLPQGNHAHFIAQRHPGAVRPGPIVNTSRRELGEHRGLPYYTIGQRRGLGLSSPEPLYVTRLEPETNTVVVGPIEALEQTCFSTLTANWIAIPSLEEPMLVTAQIRYNAADLPAHIHPLVGGGVEVTLSSPARAVTPGQSVVFYEDDLVVGGAIIA